MKKLMIPLLLASSFANAGNCEIEDWTWKNFTSDSLKVQGTLYCEKKAKEIIARFYCNDEYISSKSTYLDSLSGFTMYPDGQCIGTLRIEYSAPAIYVKPKNTGYDFTDAEFKRRFLDPIKNGTPILDRYGNAEPVLEPAIRYDIEKNQKEEFVFMIGKLDSSTTAKIPYGANYKMKEGEHFTFIIGKPYYK